MSTLNVEDIQRELEYHYPDLRVINEDGRILVRGSFPVLHDAFVLDRFQIQVEFPPDFPDSFPKTWETAGRIAFTGERHTFIGGASCLQVPEEWLSLPRSERTPLHFFQGPVHNYFLVQCFLDIGLPWPHGERSHGVLGVIESFLELLGVDSPNQIVPFFKALQHTWIKGHWDCPCGSGKIIRQCHQEHIRNLQSRITPDVAGKAIARIIEQLELHRKEQERESSV